MCINCKMEANQRSNSTTQKGKVRKNPLFPLALYVEMVR